MKLIFLGPPGVGKGTYASIISEKIGIPKIATGDLFRESMKNGTEIGLKVKKYYDAGELVPDEIVIEILKQRVEKDDCKEGFILDGFPRTIAQADELSEITKIDVVVNFVLPDDVLIEKISARRICKECGNIYNLAYIKRDGIDMPPLLPEKEGVCDKCGGELYQRKDDDPETVKNRLIEYEEKTEPLIGYYREKGLLVDYHVNSSPEKMVPKIMNLIDSKVSSHG